MKLSEIIFPLIRSEVCGADEGDKIKDEFSSEDLEDIYRASKYHDLAHIICCGLEKRGLLGKNEISQKFRKQQWLAVFRYEKIKYELENLCRIFEDNGIDFIPLKGAVIRDLYDQPWMRTSCDIDVLVKESDLDTAVKCLSEQDGYKIGAKASHDVSIFAPSDVHIELHYNLLEDVRIAESRKILSDIWSKVILKDGTEHHYLMSDEMFYFYHIAHMAKHFENGGCGIRTFLDMWLLNHRLEYDREKRRAMLSDGGLLPFADACEKLSEVWFSGKEHDELTMSLAEHILHSGIYGSTVSRVAIKQAGKGGKFSYIMSRIFPPYEEIKYQYPILQKHKCLTPFMVVRRWFNLLKKDKAKSKLAELKINNNVSDTDRQKTAELLKKLDL